MPKGCQWSSLTWIFDVKKGSYAVDSSTLRACSSVIQNLSIRLLLLIAKANKLETETGDIGSTCINANVGEQVYSRAGSEWDEKTGCTLEIMKALHILSTLARL